MEIIQMSDIMLLFMLRQRDSKKLVEMDWNIIIA